MKKLIFIFLIALSSCKKETNNSNTIDNLFTETKDNVQINEPVLLSFGDNTTAQAIVWKCEPNNGVTINQVGAYTTTTFANAGTYTVTALNSKKQGTYIVKVINKIYDEIGGDFSLTASKIINVNKNEDVVFTVHNTTQAVNQLDWSYAGLTATNKGYNVNNTAVTLSFQTAGEKYVTITNGTNKQTRTIWVNDLPQIDIVNMPFIFSDKLYITPSIETIGSNKNVVFTTATTFNYQCNTDKIFSAASSNNNSYLLSFGGVAINATPCNTIAPAKAVNNFTNMPIGVYSFSINYQNKTFVGTIAVATDGTYTINFNDNNLIVFTTKIVK